MVHAKKPTIKPSAHHASDAKAIVMQAKSFSVELSCPACDGATHSLFQCSTFKSWDQERRHRLVKRIKLCYNCLGKGYLLHNCPSHQSCKTCNRRYHSLPIGPILLLHCPIQLEFAQPIRLRLCVPIVKSPT